MAITDSEDFINLIRRLKETEESLRQSKAGLEKAVSERTAELLQTNRELSAREATYRGIIDSFSEAVYIIDETGQFIDVNKGAERMYGYTRDELIGMSPASVSAPGRNDLPAVVEKCRLAYFGEPQEMEFWGMAKDGRIFPKEVHAYPGEYFGKKVIVAIAQDITGRKQLEEVFRASEAQLSNTLSIAHLGPWEYDVINDLFTFNDHFYSMLRTDVGQVGGYTLSSADYAQRFMHPDDMPLVASEIQKAIETDDPGYCGELEHRVLFGDGEHGYIAVRIFIEKDAAGRTVKTYGVNQDITGRRKAEEALRESEELYRLLTELSPSAISVADPSGIVRMLNPKSLYLFGHEHESEVVGRSMFEWVAEESQAMAFHALQDLFMKDSVMGLKLRLLRRDGSLFHGEVNASLLRNAHGEPRLLILVISDITQEKQAEEERLKLQKLEAIGTLAGGIAHDFNNLLQGVFGYISMARLKMGDKEMAQAMLDQAEKALTMSVNLTSQLLTFAKGGKPLKKKISLKPSIENFAKFALSGSRSDYRLVVAEDLWNAEVDEGQLGQVIQNIVLNASEAMPEGGTVVIGAENIELAAGSNLQLPEGGKFVRISIRDVGTGIPTQYLSKIFDPYFTTKQKGSGLGLATSYSIMKNHGGAIEVMSGTGGSTFSIYLPAVEYVEDNIRCPAASSGRKGRMLVMDDEEMVRNIATEMLETLGHESDCAADGEEAIEKFENARQLGSPYDVVILDLTVKGGMGGEAAIKKIRQIDPNVVAVVSSGYADNSIIADYQAYGFSAFLNKPYRIDTLKDCLNELLGRK